LEVWPLKIILASLHLCTIAQGTPRKRIGSTSQYRRARHRIACYGCCVETPLLQQLCRQNSGQQTEERKSGFPPVVSSFVVILHEYVLAVSSMRYMLGVGRLETFNTMSVRQLYRLAEASSFVDFKPGELIIEQGSLLWSFSPP
jgi:hypothetical protein